MTRRLARAKIHDITNAQEVGLHAQVCGRRGCRQKLAIQQKAVRWQFSKNWQFNKTTKLGNSTKVEIQQNGKFNKKWKFSKTGNSRWLQCVHLAISPHPFYKSGMAVSVHSFNVVIYHIPCSCGQVYIGETKQRLETRLKEHRDAFDQL